MQKTLRNYQIPLPPRRNSVKKLKTQSRRDPETQRNKETLRLCVFVTLCLNKSSFPVNLPNNHIKVKNS